MGALGALLQQPAGDPFEPEVVAVPTRGMERWLSQQLAGVLGATAGRSDGVCANVTFPFPGSLVAGALAVATGVEPETDPWPAERSVWPLLEVVDDCRGEDWLAPLTAHIRAGGEEPGRRFAVVRHVADLYDRYAVHRPAMVLDWARGGSSAGSDQPLAEDLVWQATLWRHLRAHLGTASPAERMADAAGRLREDPGLLDLPRRISLFGLTRLPASYLEVLWAIAAGRDVHLWLLHPSPVLWDRVREVAGACPAVPSRRDDPTANMARNRLLASWGRDAREMQVVLAAAGPPAGAPAGTPPAIPPDDHHVALDEPAAALLGRIQADLRADRQPPGPPPPDQPDRRVLLDAGDRSLQVHACHGRARQVEVLRDAILHLLADDPTLEPRDVIVMCPDIDAFAPLIYATFGLDPEGGVEEGAIAQALRVRLADRSLRQTNPLLATVSQVLELASSRCTAADVADFIGLSPVRQRFGLDGDDLARVNEWVAATGVRWGLDAAQRAPFGLDGVSANTWRAGLDRLLLGVAMSEDGPRLVGGTLPLDDVDSGDIELVGRLAELLDRIGVVTTALSRTQPLESWVAAIRAAADVLTATTERDGWQRLQLDRLLTEVLDESGADGQSIPGADGPAASVTSGPALGVRDAGATCLGPGEIQDLLADRLRGRPTRANFRTGHLTMCTLVPMRSVPHRVVCLLGLDDGVFPRRTAPDGDDLVERDPWVGDRDPRSEDRQLLLDALLAAREHLVITYSGRDERTNLVRPPAVPLGELLDAVDATARTETGRPARELVVTHHRLQPFDPSNFQPGKLVPSWPWSFDGVALAGAQASVGPRHPPAAFIEAPLPPLSEDPVELRDLIAFVRHPARAFLRRRLGIVLPSGDVDQEASVPVELGPLEQWDLGQRLLEARLAGVAPQWCRAVEAARGRLPPGPLGSRVLDKVLPVAEDLAGVALNEAAGRTQTSVDIAVQLAQGPTLIGTVAEVFGDVVRDVTYSRVQPRHRLASWVRLLALSATRPECPWRAVVVGRTESRARRPVTAVRLGPLGDDPKSRRDAALDHLGVLLDLYARGMREPLPLYCATSASYARARADGATVDEARVKAQAAWETDPSGVVPQEDLDREHQLILGGQVPFRRLLEVRPAGDEHGPGWDGDEATRFGRLARRLWDGPILRSGAAPR